MNRTLIILTIAATVLGGAAASAQPYGDRDRDGVPNRVDRDRDGDGIRNNRDPNPNNARNPAFRNDNRGHHRWTRGERLDRRWHNRSYVVNDYRRYGWRAPPRGYAYYRTDTGDVVLAAVATGIISSVIANALAR